MCTNPAVSATFASSRLPVCERCSFAQRPQLCLSYAALRCCSLGWDAAEAGLAAALELPRRWLQPRRRHGTARVKGGEEGKIQIERSRAPLQLLHPYILGIHYTHSHNQRRHPNSDCYVRGSEASLDLPSILRFFVCDLLCVWKLSARSSIPIAIAAATEQLIAQWATSAATSCVRQIYLQRTLQCGTACALVQAKHHPVTPTEVKVGRATAPCRMTEPNNLKSVARRSELSPAGVTTRNLLELHKYILR